MATEISKGWKLPTGGENGQFKNLTTSANILTSPSVTDTTLLEQSSAKIQALPYRFSLAGYVDNGALGVERMYGVWWSCIPNTTSYAYRFNVGYRSVYSTDSNSRYLGLSLRCITTPTS